MLGIPVLAAITIGSIILFIIAAVISAAIVYKMKISNLWMIIIIPAVMIVGWILIWVLKIALLMIPLIIIGIIVYYFLSSKAGKEANKINK